MEDLEKYVDRLFANHRQTRETRELRAEILSNLEAKVADYMDEGMTYAEAFTVATQHIDTVDSLVEDSNLVYINRYKVDLIQTGLLYLVIAWVLSVPARMVYAGVMVNTLLAIAVLVVGVVYLLTRQGGEERRNQVGSVDRKTIVKLHRAAWLVWGLYIVVVSAFTTVQHFGSRLWFGRALSINGPYQFAVVVMSYLLPLCAIIVPFVFRKAVLLADEHEVNGK